MARKTPAAPAARASHAVPISPRKLPPARQREPGTRSAPSKELLVFPNPAPGRDYVIRFEVPEFTCCCPLTGQPDFAHFTIEMIADRLCVELKSLKLYFWSYRDEGAFHEAVTNSVLDDIVGATAPRFIRISAHWFVRGGITTHVVAEHRKPGWQPQPEVTLPRAAGQSGAIG